MKFLLYVIIVSSTTLVDAQDCRIAGQVFFADVVDHAITIKTDSGDLVNFNYDSAASFLRSDASANRVLPEQLNIGDFLCVRAVEPVVVAVTPRHEINVEQKKELAAWQADSLYGVVSGLDRKSRAITLAVSTGDKNRIYSVDVSPNAVYWFFPRNAIRLSDAVTGSLDQVTLGDTLYIRGTKTGASQKYVASLIVSGGFRSFAATIKTMEILVEQVRVRLVLSGNERTVHVGLGELYAIRRAGVAAAGEAHRLHRIEAADLQPGDTVLILGINEGPDSVRAIALIAGLSPFGALPSDPSQQMRWIFDNIPLGDLH
jgi:hypothetical protein